MSYKQARGVSLYEFNLKAAAMRKQMDQRLGLVRMHAAWCMSVHTVQPVNPKDLILLPSERAEQATKRMSREQVEADIQAKVEAFNRWKLGTSS